MKKLFIILVIAISVTACNNADKSATGNNTPDSTTIQSPDSTTIQSPDSTTIQWPDSTFRDFGKVKEGEVLEVSFRFINTGDKNLVISDVKPGCGCTDGEKPAEPIAPGKEGVIKAKFNSKGQHIGEARKNITVTANTKPSPVIELSFKAEVTN